VVYEELEPAADQADIVACFWRFEIEPTDAIPFEHVIVPDGTVSLMHYEADRGDWQVSIAGPGIAARKIPVEAAGRWIGLRLRAGVVGPLFGMAAAELRGRSWALAPSLPLANEWHAALAGCVDLAEGSRRLAPFVARWKAAAQPIDPVAVAAARAIAAAGGDVVIKELAASLGLSPRQLRRRFIHQVGLTPKEYARARRARRAFVEALRELKSRWSDLSSAAGYADQAHLVREFRSIFGMPPQAIDAYIRGIRHQRIVDA
jgi:AraC-like DNA-binding protein